MTKGSSWASLANLCLHQDSACLLSGDALPSQASANRKGEESQDSSTLDLGLDGQGIGAPGDPIDLSIPTG